MGGQLKRIDFPINSKNFQSFTYAMDKFIQIFIPICILNYLNLVHMILFVLFNK